MIAPDAGGFDWSRYGPAIVWTLVVAIIGALARGQGVRFVHLLFRAEEERAVDTILHTLESKGGRARLKNLTDELYGDRMKANDTALAGAVTVANANRDSLTAVVESQKMQGHALALVQERVQEVPRMIDALESLAATTQEIAKDMQAMNVSLARLDEREKERERRWHDVKPNPGNREGD